jgi:PAS domain S-box-containing protein
MNVLIVDDLALNLAVLRAMLEADDFTVFEASDGRQALAVLEEAPIDAIVSDILMPHMDGYRLCREVRGHPRFRTLPFLFYTATYTSESDQKLSLGLGADRFLRKPVNRDALLAVLKEVTAAPRPAFGPTPNPREELGLMKEYSQCLVTKLEQKNAALAESQRQLSLLVNHLEGIVWEADAEPFRLTFINRQAERLLGYPVQRWLGEPDFWWRIVHPSDCERVCAGRRAPASSLGARELEYRVRAADGRTVWLHESVAALRDTRPTAKLCGIATDITERKGIEDSLRQRESRLRAVFDLSSIGLAQLDAAGRFALANPCFAHTLGCRVDELRGLRWQEVNQGEMAWSSHGGGVPTAVEATRRERQIRRRDGTGVWVIEDVCPIQAAGAEPAGHVVALVDITDRKRAEEALRDLLATWERRVEQRTADLREANQELEAFSYSISHDLRAPLRAIDGFSRVLAEDHAERLDGEGLRVLNVVRGEAQRMARLLDELLAFSRLGRQPLRLAPTDMTALARSAFSEATAALPGRRVAFNLAPLPPANGDATLLRQVLVNLFSNAVKFSGTRQRPRIEVRGHRGDGENLYAVCDNGVGFDMRHAHRLFGVFQRLHGDEFPGTGVGLAIVQRIIHRHGGQVGVEAKPDEGATFSFTLPDPNQSPYPA